MAASPNQELGFGRLFKTTKLVGQVGRKSRFFTAEKSTFFARDRAHAWPAAAGPWGASRGPFWRRPVLARQNSQFWSIWSKLIKVKNNWRHPVSPNRILPKAHKSQFWQNWVKLAKSESKSLWTQFTPDQAPKFQPFSPLRNPTKTPKSHPRAPYKGRAKKSATRF